MNMNLHTGVVAMRTKTLPTLLLAAAATLFAQGALAQVAKVNGVTIPQARADTMLREITAQGRPDSPELRAQIKQELISREIMAQEAANGSEQKPRSQHTTGNGPPKRPRRRLPQ
jgi:hypothetical protein